MKKNKDNSSKKNAFEKQERLNENLYRAACSGNSFMVRQIIQLGADVNYHDRENGETPLHAAVASGSAATVKDLLNRGADVAQTDNSGKTPLFYVNCENYSEQIVTSLLQAKADPNKLDDLGRSPLAAIVSDLELTSQESGCIKLIKALFYAGANIDATDEHGNTLLVWSLLHGFHKMSQQLISYGASLDHKNDKNKTAIQYAAITANWKMLSVMLMKQKPEENTCIEKLYENEYSASNLDDLKFCYEHADFDNPEGWAQYMFYGACDNGSLSEIMFLVNNGLSRFDMNIDGLYGNRVLHNLCMRKRKELIIRVLEAGADPNISNDDGIPPIAFMGNRADLSIQEILYKYGFNPNFVKPDFSYITYLTLRAKADQLRLALKYGKKPNYRSSKGFSLLMLAGGYFQDMLIDDSAFDIEDYELEDYDFEDFDFEDIDDNLDNWNKEKRILVIQEAVLESVKVLVEAGADINYYPSNASEDCVAANLLRKRGFTLAANYLCQLPQANPSWAKNN